ncbi:MAG: EamA family transporter RarD [Clostridiaceae bacterium]|nr:EamA family transporter RarD [Clostridiaceae bacterium]
MNKSETQDSRRLTGILLAIGSFMLWGVLPLYWKLLNEIPADEILSHRIFWSFVFLIGILFYQRKLKDLKVILSDKKTLFMTILCAVTISINWFTYIWAVNSNFIVEASMGYYINPLVVVFLAMVVMKEKLELPQKISIFLAAIGVGVMTVQYGRIPWVSLILAISFGLYGLFKKLTKIDSIRGLALETFIIMPIALGYILFKQITGVGALGTISLTTFLILTLSGVVTATPLLMFAEAAKRVPLSMVGFAQYISPTISLMIGVFIFKEDFTKIHFISFSLIWTGLIIYSISQTKLFRKIATNYSKQVKEQKI